MSTSLSTYLEALIYLNEYFEGDAQGVAQWLCTRATNLEYRRPIDLLRLGDEEAFVEFVDGFRELAEH